MCYLSVTANTLYTAERGFGLDAGSEFGNSASGNPLFDDYVLDPTLYVDLPAGYMWFVDIVEPY